MDKVKERTRRSTDERRGSEESASNRRLSALIDRGSRRLMRKEKDNNTTTNNNTLSVHSGDSAGDLALSDTNGSLLDEDGNSSLLTDDGSDIEGYVLECLIALCHHFVLPLHDLFFLLHNACHTPLFGNMLSLRQEREGERAHASLRAESELSLSSLALASQSPGSSSCLRYDICCLVSLHLCQCSYQS